MNSTTLKISFRFLMCCQLNHSGGFKSVHVKIHCNIMKNRLRILCEINVFCFVQIAYFIHHITMKPSKTRAQLLKLFCSKQPKSRTEARNAKALKPPAVQIHLSAMKPLAIRIQQDNCFIYRAVQLLYIAVYWCILLYNCCIYPVRSSQTAERKPETPKP